MWPDDRDLPIEVEAAFGANLDNDPSTWSWTDLSARLEGVASQLPIRIKAGRSSGAAKLSPSTCSVTLSNDDAALSPLHPLSPYWPNVELGTPLRVRLRRAEDAFARTVSGGWGTSDSGQVWTSAGGSGSSYSVSGGAGRHSHTSGTVLWETLGTSLLDVEQVVDVATSAMLTGGSLVTGVVARRTGSSYYWLRTEFDQGSSDLILKITKVVAGVFTDLAVLDPVPSIAYTANTPYRMRASVVGDQLAIRVWPVSGTEPAGWNLFVQDSAITAPGATGVQSWLVAGNTNTPPVTASFSGYTARVDRFNGFADQWEPTYVTTSDPDETVSAVKVTASGILRRYQQGERPVWSAMRWSIWAARSIADLLAYWPCEDEPDSGQAASGLPGGTPLRAVGTVEFGTLDPVLSPGRTFRYGTSSLPDLSDGGGLVGGAVTPGTASPVAWTVQWAAREGNPSGATGEYVLMSWRAGGSLWEVVLTGPPSYNTRLRVDGVTRLEDDTSYAGFYEWRVTARQSGSNIIAQLIILGADQGDIVPGGVGPWSATWAGTLGWPTDVGVNPSAAVSAPSEHLVGHIQVWEGTNPPSLYGNQTDEYGVAHSGPWFAFSYEPALARMTRVAVSAYLPLTVPSVPETSVIRMGAQDEGTDLELIQECVDVDGGLLVEQGYGLAYIPREQRYNPPTTLTVDLSTYRVSDNADPLAPVYDDQDIRNEWTASRPGGSSVTVSDPVSQRRGVYSDSIDLNLYDDSSLADQASWRLRLTSAVDLREPSIPIDLAANPQLVDGWLSCRPGSRIVRTNPPSQHRPGDLDRLLDGYTETLAPRAWQVQFTGSPADRWDVAVADGTVQRVAADGSTLAADITSTATSLSLASTADNGIWTTDPAEFPLDIRVGGERMTVSAISGGSSPQTVTVSARGVNGVQRSWPAGTEVDVWLPAIASL